MALADILIQFGAPLLKSAIEQHVGGLGGRVASSAVDTLAEALGTQPTPEAIEEYVQAHPQEAAPVIQRVEQDMTRIVESMTEQMKSYHQVLLTDAQSKGVLARLWRPLFALVFTACYAVVVITICWLMWSRQLGTLTQLAEVTAFLTFAFIAGCALLGVSVWRNPREER